jgi:hypothetical protein
MTIILFLSLMGESLHLSGAFVKLSVDRAIAGINEEPVLTEITVAVVVIEDRADATGRKGGVRAGAQ